MRHHGDMSRTSQSTARVIDSDIHTIEFRPLLEQYVAEYGGGVAVDRLRACFDPTLSHLNSRWHELTASERRRHRPVRAGFWGIPVHDARGLAMLSMPRLLNERLEEAGVDFAVLQPNVAFLAVQLSDEELRRQVVRAVNHYHADLYRPYRSRITPAAIVTMHTPEEAIAELEFAVGKLGSKVARIPCGVRRPIAAVASDYPPHLHPDVVRYASWLDLFGLDSEYDYDPVWARLISLGVVATVHQGAIGWTGRASSSNYLHNQIGCHAESMQALAKALFFGGVTRRFPRLRIGLLEAGAAWGVGVYRQLCDAFGRRSRRAIQRSNPARLDRDEFHRYWREYGAELRRDREYSKDELATLAFGCLGSAPEQSDDVDDFALAGVESEHDIRDRFVNNFWFGTGPDDPSVASAFNVRDNPLGAELRPMWGTDLGHWDAPDLSEALAETRALVERGILSEDQFAKVVFSNPHAFYTDLAPDFFQGTTLESKPLTAEPPT